MPSRRMAEVLIAGRVGNASTAAGARGSAGRLGRAVQPVPLLRMLRARPFTERPRGSGWRAVQRHRIERAAVW